MQTAVKYRTTGICENRNLTVLYHSCSKYKRNCQGWKSDEMSALILSKSLFNPMTAAKGSQSLFHHKSKDSQVTTII